METIRKAFEASEIKQVDENSRSLLVKISTKSPDRYGDEMNPAGVKLENYFKNPVVAAFHRYDEPAIGRTKSIKTTDDGVIAEVEFTPVGVNPIADQLFEMYKQGFMNAWSIGFTSDDYTTKQDNGRVFNTWELLEYSAVLVPANPEALTVLRTKGVNTDLIEKALNEPEKKEPETKEVKTPSDPEIKEGRVLSEKNRSLISSTVEKMKEVSGALGELLDATNTDKTIEPGKPCAKSDEERTDEALSDMRDFLRDKDKEIGLILRDLNTYFSSKGGDK